MLVRLDDRRRRLGPDAGAEHAARDLGIYPSCRVPRRGWWRTRGTGHANATRVLLDDVDADRVQLRDDVLLLHDEKPASEAA